MIPLGPSPPRVDKMRALVIQHRGRGLNARRKAQPSGGPAGVAARRHSRTRVGCSGGRRLGGYPRRGHRSNSSTRGSSRCLPSLGGRDEPPPARIGRPSRLSIRDAAGSKKGHRRADPGRSRDARHATRPVASAPIAQSPRLRRENERASRDRDRGGCGGCAFRRRPDGPSRDEPLRRRTRARRAGGRRPETRGVHQGGVR